MSPWQPPQGPSSQCILAPKSPQSRTLQHIHGLGTRRYHLLAPNPHSDLTWEKWCMDSGPSKGYMITGKVILEFLGTPLIFNGAPRNIQGNLAGMHQWQFLLWTWWSSQVCMASHSSTRLRCSVMHIMLPLVGVLARLTYWFSPPPGDLCS